MPTSLILLIFSPLIGIILFLIKQVPFFESASTVRCANSCASSHFSVFFIFSFIFIILETASSTRDIGISPLSTFSKICSTTLNCGHKSMSHPALKHSTSASSCSYIQRKNPPISKASETTTPENPISSFKTFVIKSYESVAGG